MKEKLLNVSEISNVLNLSKSCIYNYVKRKMIPCVTLNGRVLFSESAINSWINANKHDVIVNDGKNNDV